MPSSSSGFSREPGPGGSAQDLRKPHAEDMVVRAIPQQRRQPGDEWTRHCDKCDQNVYNLSAMTAREAEALLELYLGAVEG